MKIDIKYNDYYCCQTLSKLSEIYLSQFCGTVPVDECHDNSIRIRFMP